MDVYIGNLIILICRIVFVYENILGIACYHISDYKFNIYDKLNLTLDSNY